MTEPSQYFKGRTVQEQMNEVIGYVDTRSAEVATAAIASDVAQVHQDMLDADADAQAAAASAAAAAGTLANAVKKTGEASQSIAGDIAVSGNLTGGSVTVPAPVNNTDAANKKYVDDADALKLAIADINSYAVGLTGNQGSIAGIKKFVATDFQIENNLSFNTPDANGNKRKATIYVTTPTMFFRVQSQPMDSEFAELRISCNRQPDKITWGLYLLSYQNINGTATLVDYHPIYEKVVNL